MCGVFKSVFQQPENAAAELQHVLSAEHVSAIDWSTLKLEPGSYVDEKLADQHSDLLFSANAQASGERVFVYLLFEHQTPGGQRALAPLLSYVVRVSSDLQLEQFRAILKERAPAAESITMTIAEQLLAEGKAQGVAQGELRRAAASVLTVLDARGLVVTSDVRRRVEECSELEVLQEWLVRAATVAAVDEVFEG